MQVEQILTENQKEAPTRILETVELRCGYFPICPSPSRSDSWACRGHVTDDDRLLMCASFNRFLNPERKPDYMSERDWIKVLQRKVRANVSAGEKLRDKTRNPRR